MNNIKYNLFLMFSNITRNLVEVFNIVLLYKLSYSIKEILLYYFIFFLLSIIVNIITFQISNIIKNKYILIISNLLFCFSYYFLNTSNHNMSNLVIFAIISSFASYTYHFIRHYFALKYTDSNNKEIGNIIIFSYLGLIISSYLGPFITDKYSLSVTVVLLFIFGILSIIPLLLINDSVTKEKFKNISIDKRRKLFFVLEQSKVLFLLIQPMFLYLFVSNNIKYIGIFNVITCISSIIFIKYIVKKDNILKYFKFLNILLVIILLLKLNIDSKYFILIIAIFEGIFIKLYEIVSTKNFYQVRRENIKSYLLKSEIIFCLTRTIFMLIFYLFFNDIKIILYILLLFIFVSGFICNDT